MTVKVIKQYYQFMNLAKNPMYSRYDIDGSPPLTPRELIDLWIWDTYDMITNGLRVSDLDYDKEAIIFGDLWGDNRIRLTQYQERESDYVHISSGGHFMWRGLVSHGTCYAMSQTKMEEVLVEMTISEAVAGWLEEMGWTYGYTD